MRDTEVQQPKTTATLSCETSWRAFSAKSGQLEAGSTTTGTSFFPMTPPEALISAMVMRAVSFSAVSEMAMVPEREWRMPTLIVSSARAASGKASAKSATGDRAFRSRTRIRVLS